MERNIRLSRTPIGAFLEGLETVKTRFFGPHPPRDPDPEQLFSDSIERAMMLRELHCR
jgi:hypothetical protein